MLKECTKLKTIPCEWRVEETLCNTPQDIDCHYAEPLDVQEDKSEPAPSEPFQLPDEYSRLFKAERISDG